MSTVNCNQCQDTGYIDNPDASSNLAIVECTLCNNPEGKEYQCPCNDCTGVSNVESID